MPRPSEHKITRAEQDHNTLPHTICHTAKRFTTLAKALHLADFHGDVVVLGRRPDAHTRQGRVLFGRKSRARRDMKDGR